MRQDTLNYIRPVLVAVCFCPLVGCWQEIEYVEPQADVSVPPLDPSRAEVEQLELPASGNSKNEQSSESGEHLIATVETPPQLPNLEPASHVHGSIAASSPTEQIGERVLSANPHTIGKSVEIDSDRAPVVDSRRAAWQLGSKLSLAALAQGHAMDTGQVATWMHDARQAAEFLGTSFAELPKSATDGDNQTTTNTAHRYLLQQGQQVWQDLSKTHGLDHAALFEIAVKSNVLLVLYEPGGSTAKAISAAIAQSAPRTGLPENLWRPLLEVMDQKLPPAELHAAVRQMHAAVDQHLALNQASPHD
jgi:hypothetical protein